MFALFALLGMPATAFAEQGPGYGGNADGLTVTWEEPKDKAMAAPPPVPTDENGGTSDGPVTDPQRLALNGEAATLNVEGIGFRGLSEVTIQFGNQDTVAVRADPTGTVSSTFASASSDAPGTTVVAVGRGPSGATRTLVGSIPPLPSGTNLMGVVPWLLVVPVVLLVALSLMRQKAEEQYDPDLVFAAAPTGPPLAALPAPPPDGELPPPPPAGRALLGLPPPAAPTTTTHDDPLSRPPTTPRIY